VATPDVLKNQDSNLENQRLPTDGARSAVSREVASRPSQEKKEAFPSSNSLPGSPWTVPEGFLPTLESPKATAGIPHVRRFFCTHDWKIKHMDSTSLEMGIVNIRGVRNTLHIYCIRVARNFRARD
jgi:hypothetical protein